MSATGELKIRREEPPAGNQKRGGKAPQLAALRDAATRNPLAWMAVDFPNTQANAFTLAKYYAKKWGSEYAIKTRKKSDRLTTVYCRYTPKGGKS